MPARLLYRDGQGRDAYVDLSEAAPLFLGRGTDCAIRTEDAMVSRKNTKVSFSGGRFFAEDLGSANGTFVNERRVQKQQLSHADVVRCGSLQVRYVEIAAQAGGRPRTQELNQQGPAVAVSGDLMQQVEGALASASSERDNIRRQFDDARGELEALRAKADGADSELKRLRAESLQSREELTKVKRDAAQDKEELQAITRVAEELKRAQNISREESTTLKVRLEEMTEEMAARDRQLERAQEDVQRTKQTMEELRNKLAELQKTKDEGWRELNSQLAQVEHLREVIAEQERILEERRVGLISLESVAKDMRADKEKVLRELVDTKNSRDELKDRLVRAEAKVEGLEEEHRRLARAINEGGVAGGDELTRIADELRNFKVDYKKLETDLARALENLTRAETDRQALSDQKAKVEVERSQLLDDKKAADTARVRAEEARAKAESLRQRAEEEKQSASAARDTALQAAEDLRRSVERADRKMAEVQKASGDGAEVQRQLEAAQGRIAEMEHRLAEASSGNGAGAAAAAVEPAAATDDSEARRLAGEVKRLEAELARLHEDLHQAAALSDDGGTNPGAVVGPGGGGDGPGVGELRQRAQDVYDGINSALSELRTTIITAKGLFGEVGPKIADEDARRALGDALGDSMERTEDAKGLLRTLKELAEG